MKKSIDQIRVNDTLSELNSFENLYAPAGKADIRLIEDIFTREGLYVYTDGNRVTGIIQKAEPGTRRTFHPHRKKTSAGGDDLQMKF